MNLVNVPVVVRDSKGHPIGSLKKEDFQLFDKGKPQVISKFTIEKADGRAVPFEVTAEPHLDKSPDKTESAVPPASRFVAYLFDDMHTSFGDLAQSRKAAAKYLDETMKAADRAAIYTTSTQTMLDFTDDREKIKETMNRIQPRSRSTHGVIDCPDVSGYMADLIVNKNDARALAQATRDAIACGTPPQMAGMTAMGAAQRVNSVADADAQTSLAVLKATVQRLAAMPGQRTIVLVSSGFLVNLDHRSDQMEVIEQGIRASATISTLDARGLWAIVPGGDASQASVSAPSALKNQYQFASAQAQGDVLAALADGTGGTYFHDNNDLQEGFRRTGATPEFMYVLGFAPQNLKFDGSFHSLKVTAKDTKGVTLQARRGYYAPKHAKDPAEDAKEEIRVAVFSRDELSDIPLELKTQFFKTTATNAKLSVLAQVDLKHLRFKKKEGRNGNTLTFVSAVFDRNGMLVGATEKEIEMNLKDDTFEARIAAGVALKTSFDVAPGSYVIRLIVRDKEGETMAARNGVVEIP